MALVSTICQLTLVAFVWRWHDYELTGQYGFAFALLYVPSAAAIAILSSLGLTFLATLLKHHTSAIIATALLVFSLVLPGCEMIRLCN